jgi:hypothetical protein
MQPSERQQLIDKFSRFIKPLIKQNIAAGHKGISIKLNSATTILLTCRISMQPEEIFYSLQPTFDAESQKLSNFCKNENNREVEKLLTAISSKNIKYRAFP